MGQAIVRAFTDSHVRKDMPDRAFSISALLRVAGSGRADHGHAFLWCPRPFPLGAVITSATLRLHSRDPLGVGATLRLDPVAERFTVTQATWNGQPPVRAGAAVAATRASVPWDAPWAFDVTSHMRAIAAGQAWWGWRISTSTAAALLRIYSSDHSSGLRPELTVEWSDQPSRPTGLSPAGGAAVTVAKPVLSYVFSDVSGDTSLARSGIQIHTSPITTGTPEWSGEVVTTEPVIDLADTSFPGIPAGGSRWWRVRAQDGAGMWSDWSDWTQVARAALPSLTLAAPADGAIITSPTPVVRWSVSGGSQESYQVLVWDKDRRTRFYTSGRVASSTARAHTIPAGVVSRDDTDYRVEIRIWDPVRRAPQPGVPLFMQRDVTVTWDRDGSLTPTALSLAPTADQVGMVLSWTRASDPGSWAVLRDGQVVDVVDSSDVVRSGGWRWTDWGAHPRRDHTWEVAPVVNDVTGRGQKVTGRLEPIGVWLVRPQTGERVMVTNDDVPGGWGMAEQSTSHLPLGARRPVLVTQGMGGYQGRTSGELTGMDHRGGPSAQDQRDIFLDLKSRQGATMRLVLADQNLPVTCWGMTVAPSPAGKSLRFAVTWEWAQVAEFDYEPEYL